MEPPPNYEIKEPKLFDIFRGVPSDKAFVHPETLRRGVWTADRSNKLERGFCNNFYGKNSFNINAGLNQEQLQHAERVLTQYRYFTRNKNTNLNAPLDPKMLHDRKFINMAEAFIRKKMQPDPIQARMNQPRYQTAQSKQGKDMTLNVLGSQAIMNIQDGLAMKRPMTATIR